MPVHNSEIARVLNKVGDLLDIEGSNPYRVRAYRNAARTVEGLPQSLSDMMKRGDDLSRLPGIGKDLAGKIGEILETGTLSQLREIEKRAAPELDQLMRIENLGPKRVQTLHKKLGITNLKELKAAAKAGKISGLPGFGKKTEQAILERVKEAKAEREERTKLVAAEQVAGSLENYLQGARGVKEIAVAGSYRRRKETVRDLDILVTCKKGSRVMDHFVTYEDVERVVSKGKTRSTVVLRSGMHVDLRVVAQVSYGAALHYFTGSKEHNIAVRQLGVKRNLKINEYGVFRGQKRIAGKTEKEVYKQVDLPYIEPELRENRGEIEAAQDRHLPKLVTLSDIRGDLHVHTKRTDGRHSLEEMAQAARERGYEYLAITDHSKRVTMARGLDAKKLGSQIKEIERVNDKLDGILVLKGIELDILEDGSLDLPDEILKELDLRVCAVHYNRNLSREKQTERIIRAMDNPYFNILAHPSGRLINERDPYDVDMERLIRAAKERGCIMEVNAHPDRLDLDDHDAKMAKDMGVKMVISTDAHRMTDLELMRFGVYQARRGWLEPGDVLNTRGLKELKKALRRN